MYELSQGIYCCYLLGLSMLDIWKRRLPFWMLAAGVGAAAFLQWQWGTVPFALAAAGGAVGLVFLAVSYVTEEGFGYGDSLLIIALGILLGFWQLLGVLLLAFGLTGILGVVLLWKKKWRRKTGIPFVPFLFLAYMIWGLLEGGRI